MTVRASLNIVITKCLGFGFKDFKMFHVLVSEFLYSLFSFIIPTIIRNEANLVTSVLVKKQRTPQMLVVSYLNDLCWLNKQRDSFLSLIHFMFY